MAVLKEIHKLFIVQRLAIFEKPSQVVEAVSEEFGIKITRMQVQKYDASKPYFDGAEKWKTIFEDTRKKFLENTSEIPIASKSFRLKKMQESFERQESQQLKNEVLMLNILEQAAKDSGDVFTNKTKQEIDQTINLPEQLADAVSKALLKVYGE